MDNIFNVVDGKIYNNLGVEIDNITIIIDKNTGLLKHGTSKKEMNDIYKDMVSKYRRLKFENIADALMLVDFDMYNDILSKEEICIFLNFMLMCSANGDTVMEMLYMDKDNLKK